MSWLRMWYGEKRCEGRSHSRASRNPICPCPVSGGPERSCKPKGEMTHFPVGEKVFFWIFQKKGLRFYLEA